MFVELLLSAVVHCCCQVGFEAHCEGLLEEVCGLDILESQSGKLYSRRGQLFKDFAMRLFRVSYQAS